MNYLDIRETFEWYFGRGPDFGGTESAVWRAGAVVYKLSWYEREDVLFHRLAHKHRPDNLATILDFRILANVGGRFFCLTVQAYVGTTARNRWYRRWANGDDYPRPEAWVRCGLVDFYCEDLHANNHNGYLIMDCGYMGRRDYGDLAPIPAGA